MTDPLPSEARPALPSPETIDRLVVRALARLDRALPDFVGAYPAPSSVGGFYPAIANDEWTNGFWTGALLLGWELTGDEAYRTAVAAQLPQYADRIARRINVDHHDLGFLYSLSCCAAHQLTGDGDARAIALLAAQLLLDRYDPVAQVIQAWGNLNDPAQRGRMIIDCNLNLPLLWWAARETGDPKFAEAAEHHVAQAARYLVRPDASTFHTFYIDTETGAPRFGSTHQGFSDDSCWARGQAWGIYGFALAFRHTGRRAYLDLAARLADYFLAHLPSDGICGWDLIFTEDDAQRDSSAAAIAACGLLEIASALPSGDPRRIRYEGAATRTVMELDAAYLADLQTSNGLLAHGVYHWPNRVGVNECCLWGDYFYLEALRRLSGGWRSYW